MKLVVAPFLAVALALLAVAVAQDEEPDLAGLDGEFGLIRPGTTTSDTVFVDFECPGDHEVQIVLHDAPWASVIGADTVTVPSGEFAHFDLSVDTHGVDPGSHAGTATFTCVGCTEETCGETTKTQGFSILVPAPNTFGSHPNDGQFGGLVGGNVVPIETLVPNVMNDIKLSTFGQIPEGQAIIETLEEHYLENDLSDVTLVPTVDVALPNGKLGEEVQSVNGESQKPGNASYVLNRGSGWLGDALADEEIYLGIDLSTKGITEARENPDDYYVFTYEGQLGVMSKSDLVHNLVHEGLHAHLGGEHNVEGRASLEEERDGFRAGNAACEALGLPMATDEPGPGYGAPDNPDYQPLFNPPATTADEQHTGVQPSDGDGPEIVGIAGCSCPCGGSGQPACAHRGCVCASAAETAGVVGMAGCSCPCGGSGQPACAHRDCACVKGEDVATVVGTAGCGCGCGGSGQPACAYRNCGCADATAAVASDIVGMAGCSCACGGSGQPACAYRNCGCADASTMASSNVVGMAGCSCPCGGSGQPACAHRDCACVRGAGSSSDPFSTGGQLSFGIPDGFTPSNGIPVSNPFEGPMDANVLNFGPAANAGNRTGDTQVMIIVLVQTSLPPARGRNAMRDNLRPLLTIASASAGSRQGARVRTAAFHEAETGRALLESLLKPLTEGQPEASPPLSATITSLGVSTGEAFEIQMASQAAYPLDVSAAGIVVEPLKTKAGDELRREFGKSLRSAATQSFRADGYCLEYLRTPPTAGTLFRVAAPDVQKQFEPMRKILRAGQQLFDMGELLPDSDPMQYFHSVRQWALWAKERDFDLDSFGKEFLDRTKKNFAAAGQAWTKPIEETVRGLVPNRWNDIEKILDAAGVRE